MMDMIDIVVWVITPAIVIMVYSVLLVACLEIRSKLLRMQHEKTEWAVVTHPDKSWCVVRL